MRAKRGTPKGCVRIRSIEKGFWNITGNTIERKILMALDKDAFVGVHELDGAGTTGIACKKLGYDFIGIELDNDYFRIAEERIKATL